MTPDAYTIQEFFLDVGDGHQLYVHEWGNSKAKTTPIIFLHGGPGDGCKDKHRSNFDPEQHHVVFFDQRGAGRSLPYGSLEHNTTDKLVTDISAIADYLKWKQFVLVGGSWGSSLALAYAVAHPRRVKALVLDGIWTCSANEMAWLDQGGFRVFYPEVWEHYLARTPKKYHANPSEYHFKRALGASDQAASKSAYAYACMQAAVLSLDDERFTEPDPIEFDPASTKIEMHYITHHCFMPEGHILDNARKLRMPVWLVQGRYDMVCPPQTAYELHQKLSSSQLIWTVSNHRSEHEVNSVIRSILLSLA